MFRCVLAVAVAVVLSAPLTAQTPWQPPRTLDGQPDIQGMWRFDPGPVNPVGGLSALLSLEGDRGRFWPDISRMLEVEKVVQEVPINERWAYVVDPPDGRIPFRPEAEAKRREFFENFRTPTEVEHIDPNSRSWLTGVPRIHHYPTSVQIVQVPGFVVLLYETRHAYRVIPLDNRRHVGERIRLFLGDSRGRWDGDSLVVDVTNQNGRVWLDLTSPQGEGAHLVERWTRVGPDRLDYRVTYEDPSMFTRPWTVAYTFVTDKRGEMWELAEYEGERDIERMVRGGRRQKEGVK